MIFGVSRGSDHFWSQLQPKERDGRPAGDTRKSEGKSRQTDREMILENVKINCERQTDDKRKSEDQS